jgi:hypothetical protein
LKIAGELLDGLAAARLNRFAALVEAGGRGIRLADRIPVEV